MRSFEIETASAEVARFCEDTGMKPLVRQQPSEVFDGSVTGPGVQWPSVAPMEHVR